MADRLVSKRHLRVPGAYNMRDLGGYATADGRQTRWRTLVRSDGLHRLPPASQQAVFDYGIRTVIDLRTTKETRDYPNVFAGSTKLSYQRHNMDGDEALPPSPHDPDKVIRIANFYSHLLDVRKAEIGMILARLATPGVLPALYHCHGGEDRTGIISALLLGIAGVPEAVIAEDYALTGVSQYHWEDRDRPNARGSEGYPDDPREVEPGESVEAYVARKTSPRKMLLTLRDLQERYGGVEGYVRTAGLDEDQFESLRRSIVE